MKSTNEDIDLSKLHINYFYLNMEENKVLSKILSNTPDTIEAFNNLTDEMFISNKYDSKKIYITLKNIRDKVDIELDKFSILREKHSIEKRQFFISSEITFFSLNEIEKALIQDIEDYLLLIDDQSQDIILSRWGYNHEKQSLEVIGERWHLTRERIRQIESSINTVFQKYLRVHPKVLWQHIREKMTEDLIKLFPQLSSYFSSQDEFYEFIELCCLAKPGDLANIAHPKVNKKLLNSYFCNNASPITREKIIQELVSKFGYSTALAQNTLRELTISGYIKITEKGIYPSKLGRREAVAHALIEHKNGLPWKDITKIVNQFGYCNKALNENRIVNDYFSGSDYIYLSDKGTYKHLKFLDLSKIDIQSHMKYLYDYFHKTNKYRLHLNEYYSESKSSIPEIGYYELRHLIRAFGHEYGIYFSGKSSVDSISLDPKAHHVTQYEVIMNYIRNSAKPLTKQEIALKLKSKSISHATFYLDKMAEKSDIVRIDYMTYTTPNQAFDNVKNLKGILSSIKLMINSTAKIIEADFFREKINADLNLSYSKYFYSALISIKQKELNCFRINNLVCKDPIQYRNLADLFRITCNKDAPDDENKNAIRKIAYFTNDTLERSFYNWKRNHRGYAKSR